MGRRARAGLLIATMLLTGAFVLAAPAASPAEHSVVELLSTGPGPDGGDPGVFDIYASPDGRRVLFGTDSALVTEDVDNCDQPEFDLFRLCIDYYERFGGTTSLLTTGPADLHRSVDIRLEAASRDRTRAFFNTAEALVAEDTDGASDAYERTAGTTILISTGPSGQGAGSSFLRGVSEDGARAFFTTTDALVAEDGDQCIDLYERSAGTTKLVSSGVPPVPTRFLGCADLRWEGVSRDGSRVFLRTDAPVTADDGDMDRDIYEWSDTGVALISTGPADDPAGGALQPDVAISRDGRNVFFYTSEKLVPEDSDGPGFPDLYERFDGTTRLVIPPVPGDSSPVGGFNGMSEDASRVFFGTSAGLVPEDTNGRGDVYERAGDEITLISTGPLGSPGGAGWAGPFLGSVYGNNFGGVSADGRAVLFASLDPFVPEDTDNVQDIYLRANGETTLVSTGSNDVGQSFFSSVGDVILSPDGTRVFFKSFHPLATEDTDVHDDVYEWHDGRTTLVPHGVPTPGPVGLVGVLPKAIVQDGSRVFISTATSLTPDDADSAGDLYAIDLPNTAPACDTVAANQSLLWPANLRLVRISLGGATDPDGDLVTIEITGVTQDERTAGSRDAVLSSAGDEVRLRAERENRGDGRVYRIEFEATDGNGGSCSGTVKVDVPRKKNKAAVDSAPPSYDSFG